MHHVVLIAVYCILGTGLLYHYFLLVFGYRSRPYEEAAAPVNLRFAVAIPAHNEEHVIGMTVARLRQLDYQCSSFDVHVVADFCSDATAQVASSAGAIVHERSEGPHGRKGHALAWLFDRLLADPRRYDVIVVFDADSQVAPDFLHRVGVALASGKEAVQGRHIIANPGASVFSALADADMRINNRLRNQAKENLTWSARLMGDAMCLRREVLETHPFRAESLTEDREFGIYLVTQGMRVSYVREAVSAGQATTRWGDATGQRMRWYSGAFKLQRRYLGPLLAAAWQKHSWAALDLVFELSLPSFSTLCMLAIGLVVLQVALLLVGIQSPITVGLILAALVLVFPVLGLLAERAPRHCYQALISGPVYVAWRVWLGLVVRIRRGRAPWIRTRRAEEERMVE